MKVHILAEGPSEKQFLERWAPRFLREHTIRVYPHQGKGTLPRNLGAKPDPRRRGLLDQLPAKLRAFNESFDPQNECLLILVDADDDDALNLKGTIEQAIETLCPTIKANACVAIEEMESFYLGDLRAIEGTFNRPDMELARAFIPDSICGTWEYFGRVVKDDGGNKVAWAEAMGSKLTIQPGRNRSPSFRAMCGALKLLVTPPRKARPKKRKLKWRPPKPKRYRGR